jgi:hypothetical protein
MQPGSLVDFLEFLPLSHLVLSIQPPLQTLSTFNVRRGTGCAAALTPRYQHPSKTQCNPSRDRTFILRYRREAVMDGSSTRPSSQNGGRRSSALVASYRRPLLTTTNPALGPGISHKPPSGILPPHSSRIQGSCFPHSIQTIIHSLPAVEILALTPGKAIRCIT